MIGQEQGAKDLSLSVSAVEREATDAALVASYDLEALTRDEQKIDCWNLVGDFPNNCSNSS